MREGDVPLANDLLVGAKPIAAFLGVSPRKVYHWAARGHIPTFNIGPLIAARKSQLRRKMSASTLDTEGDA